MSTLLTIVSLLKALKPYAPMIAAVASGIGMIASKNYSEGLSTIFQALEHGVRRGHRREPAQRGGQVDVEVTPPVRGLGRIDQGMATHHENGRATP